MSQIRAKFNKRVNEFTQKENRIFQIFFLRERGLTFQEIAETLGYKSRQAVQQRYEYHAEYYLGIKGGELNNGKEN